MTESNFPIKLDVSATAEISGRVPDEVMGRLANALTDLLSPLTEGLGLVGDSIRAHRENQAIKRTLAARQLIDQSGLQISGAPLKFIASWAEAVSIEDENSELNDMWERLLANSSVGYEHRFLSYVEILKSMSGDEARFLKRLCRDGDLEVYYDIKRDWIDHIVGDVEALFSTLPVEWRKYHSQLNDIIAWTDTEKIDTVFEHDWKNPRIIVLFQYPQAQQKADGTVKIHNGTYHYRPGTTENIFVHRNLVRQGLAYEATILAKVNFLGQDFEVPVWFLQATEIGIDLVRTCSRFPR